MPGPEPHGASGHRPADELHWLPMHLDMGEWAASEAHLFLRAPRGAGPEEDWGVACLARQTVEDLTVCHQPARSETQRERLRVASRRLNALWNGPRLPALPAQVGWGRSADEARAVFDAQRAPLAHHAALECLMLGLALHYAWGAPVAGINRTHVLDEEGLSAQPIDDEIGRLMDAVSAAGPRDALARRRGLSTHTLLTRQQQRTADAVARALNQPEAGWPQHQGERWHGAQASATFDISVTGRPHLPPALERVNPEQARRYHVHCAQVAACAARLMVSEWLRLTQRRVTEGSSKRAPMLHALQGEAIKQTRVQ